MSIKIEKTCDICGKEVGREGYGVSDAYCLCDYQEPSGIVYDLPKPGPMVVCIDCWYPMIREARKTAATKEEGKQ